MKALSIKPVGPLKLSQTPILPSSQISERVEAGPLVPLPSTVLGALGASLGVHLDPNAVKQNPLLGIGLLINELERLGLAENEKPVLLGPLVRLENSELTVPIYFKGLTYLVRLDPKELARALEDLTIGEDAFKGYIESVELVGVSLADYTEGVKVIRPGLTFRRHLSWVVRMNGKPASYEYLYLLPGAKRELRQLVRLGGEGRQALLQVTEPDETLIKLVDRLTTPCHAVKPGHYIALSPWPLLQTKPLTVYDHSSLADPKPDRILGVLSPHGPRIHVIRLGLGYSEAASIRRPRLPALPPGTVVELREPKRCSDLGAQLARVGYPTLLKIN